MAALRASWRLALGAGCLALLVWMLRSGPSVPPVALFSAAGARNGWYAASHVVAAMALAGAAAGLWGALVRRAAGPSGGPGLMVLCTLAALALSAGSAVYPHDARYDLAIACAMALYFWAATSAVAGPGGVAPALAALAGCGVALAAEGLRQFAAGRPTPVAWTGAAAAAQIPVRVSASLGNPNALGAALLLAAGAAAALVVSVRERALRYAAMAALVPIGAAMALTFSRGCYLGAAAAAAAAAPLLPASRRLRGLAAVGCVALGFAAAAAWTPGVGLRVQSIAAGGGELASRLFTWGDTLSVWRTRPWRGVGPGGLEVLYAAHQPRVAKGTYALVTVPGSADNDALQWLAETGATGAAALALGIGVGLSSVGRGLRRQGPGMAAAGAVLLAAFAGLAVQGLWEPTAYLLPVEAMGAVALAALCGAAGLTEPPRPARLLGAGVAAGGVAVAVFLHAAWPAQRDFEAGWARVGAGQPAAGLGALAEAAAADPGSERDAAALGDAALQAAAGAGESPALLATARRELGRAVALDPYDGAAWAALAAGLRGPAAACAQQAALADFPHSAWFAAQLAGDLGALGFAGPARTDLAYAAREFVWQLAYYAEHGQQTGPEAQRARREVARGKAAWGPSPLPPSAVYPLAPAACAADLSAVGIRPPAEPFGHAPGP